MSNLGPHAFFLSLFFHISAHPYSYMSMGILTVCLHIMEFQSLEALFCFFIISISSDFQSTETLHSASSDTDSRHRECAHHHGAAHNNWNSVF